MSFALARSVEIFRIPRNVLTICLGKSTYARCGIIVNVTPFEPEWEGRDPGDQQHHAAPRRFTRRRLCQVMLLSFDERLRISYK